MANPDYTVKDCMFRYTSGYTSGNGSKAVDLLREDAVFLEPFASELSQAYRDASDTLLKEVYTRFFYKEDNEFFRKDFYKLYPESKAFEKDTSLLLNAIISAENAGMEERTAELYAMAGDSSVLAKYKDKQKEKVRQKALETIPVLEQRIPILISQLDREITKYSYQSHLSELQKITLELDSCRRVIPDEYMNEDLFTVMADTYMLLTSQYSQIALLIVEIKAENETEQQKQIKQLYQCTLAGKNTAAAAGHYYWMIGDSVNDDLMTRLQLKLENDRLQLLKAYPAAANP